MWECFTIWNWLQHHFRARSYKQHRWRTLGLESILSAMHGTFDVYTAQTSGTSTWGCLKRTTHVAKEVFPPILTPMTRVTGLTCDIKIRDRNHPNWKGWYGLVWVSCSYSGVSNSQPLLCKYIVHTCRFNWPGARLLQSVRQSLLPHVFHSLSLHCNLAVIHLASENGVYPQKMAKSIGHMMIKQWNLR